MPDHTEFFEELERRIAPYDLLTHAFYQAWTEGQLTKDDLREYAAEYWHPVSAFPTYLSALHSHLEDAELRRMVLRNLMDEEGIDSPDGKPHSALWMDFAEGMGATEADVRGRKLQPETEAMIRIFRRLMDDSSPTAALAALYTYESKVPEIARQKAAGLCDCYGADKATCRYFTLHQTADVIHAKVWKQAMEQELERNPASADRALDAAEEAAQALWAALDGVNRLRMQQIAN